MVVNGYQSKDNFRLINIFLKEQKNYAFLVVFFFNLTVTNSRGCFISIGFNSQLIKKHFFFMKRKFNQWW